MIAPCRDCKKKGCGSYHDICEKYQEFRKEQIDMQKERARESAGRTKFKTSREAKYKSHFGCHKK